ncbi:MAG TPA: nucleoside 2-deoxyribosyltransferase [Methanoregulaceae archaeon]|nr:nucleoside 2-deoxyribosyltransferase [Methanoregulaceae archaeon]
MYVLAAPCLLDPSLRAEGITSDADRAIYARALERCREFGIEVVSLPCPETLHLGSPRQPGPLAGRLDTPAFAALLDGLEVGVRAIVVERGPPLCLIGVDSSPCCGATRHFFDETRHPGRGCWLARFPELPVVDAAAFSRYHIYLAAPLFSAAERSFNEALAFFLRTRHFRVFVPQAQGDDCAARSPAAIHVLFDRLVAALDGADIVVAVIDGADADSGVAWEMGYAYAHCVPVIALRTDFRRVGDCESANLMLECSSAVAGSFDELAALLGSVQPKEGG